MPDSPRSHRATNNGSKLISGPWVPVYPRTCLPLPVGFCSEEAARMTGEATSSEATLTFYGSTLLSPGPSWGGAWHPYSNLPAGLCSSAQGSSGCHFPSKLPAHHHCFRWLLRETGLGGVLRLDGIGQHACCFLRSHSYKWLSVLQSATRKTKS